MICLNIQGASSIEHTIYGHVLGHKGGARAPSAPWLDPPQAPTIICEPGLCSVSRSSHRIMVILRAGGVRTKKDKQPRNFHLNCSLHFVSTRVYRCHKSNNCTLFLVWSFLPSAALRTSNLL